MAKVLIVEDDEIVARAMSDHLSAAGHEPKWTSKGEQGLAAIRYESPDVVVLDLMLPQRDGWSVIEHARADGIGTPIIVVSARGTEHDRIHALDIGADDYLVKPFDFEELNARIRAVIRRRQGRTSSFVTAGAVTLDLARFEVSYCGSTAILPAKEFSLLRALAERPGAILSRGQLEDRLYDWGNEVESNAVDVLIHYVRRKFDKDIIRNVRGIGWMIPAKAP
jgi:DNA-binding response OmpR family regulator